MKKNAIDIDEMKARAFALFQNNQLQEAKSLCVQIAQLDDTDATLWQLLGAVNGRLGKIDEAETALRKAIALNPQLAQAHSDLGNALSIMGRTDEALLCYRESLRLDDTSAATFNNLGSLLYKMNRWREAAASYESALWLNPDAAFLYFHLGNALMRQHETGRAAAMYRECVKRDPNNFTAQHMLAACAGDNVPERASDGYIKQSFDSFSNTFDATLSGIGYSAPSAVVDVISRICGAPAGSLDILDAGCGTGLCAPGLRGYARRLVGVDLSTGMLAKAAERSLYDQLTAAELTTFLYNDLHSYDLIVTTDVLIYFGILDKLVSGFAKRLRMSGFLVATIERADPKEAVSGFRLNAHGRYSHTEEYVRNTFSRAGLSIVDITEIVLRFEDNEPVSGLVVVGRIASPPESSLA